MKKLTKAVIGHVPDRPSRVSPTGRPTALRHLVAYHNPDEMKYEFWQCRGFSVLTNHKYNDLRGDIIWVIGRPRGTRSYFLDCRFKANGIETIYGDSRFKYWVSGNEGFVFFPYTRLNSKPWFRKLLVINPQLSLGLQVVKDHMVINGLRNEYERAQAWQEGK